MNDADIEAIYKANINESHFAGLRGVFDAGYQLGVAQAAQPATPDPSTANTEAAVLADTPVITQP